MIEYNIPYITDHHVNSQDNFVKS